LALAFGYLYNEKYLNCITKDFVLCLRSKKFTSTTGKYFFRYPNDYPITHKTGSDLTSQYGFSSGEYNEWVNFSTEFYPNAGGDSLGSVMVKNSGFNSVSEYADDVMKTFNNQPDRYKGKTPVIDYITVSGKDAIRVATSHQPSNFAEPEDNIVLVESGELYEIRFNCNEYYHKKPLEYYESSKNIILSTFTFK
jgi:hypothetical protein